MGKRNLKQYSFFKYLVISMSIITVIMLGLIKFINVLPGEYFIVLTILLGIITVGLSFLIMSKKGSKKRIVGSVISVIYMVFLILVIVYELNTIGFLKKLGFKDYKTENYSIVVLKDDEAKELKDLDKKIIGSLEFSSDGLKEAKNKIEKRITPEFKTFEDVNKLKNELLNKEIEAMLIETSILSIIEEEDENFAKNYRVVYEFSIDITVENLKNEVDITNTPFNIYISGIDTYGSVASVSRSDVNMVITVNPMTNKILITSIPRDYYVPLFGKTGKDKLTHAGIYGIDTSVKTVENLLDIKINYFVKVNFSSLVKLVDALGGVSVKSEYNFTSRDGYTYKKGDNQVNGAKALSFVRERKAFLTGDRVRVQNQAAMIEAIINKAISPSIIIKYNNILNALEDLFVTNLEMNDITKFIKKQIDDMSEWKVENISLDGSDAMDYTYSYGSQKLYVMKPKEETIINAKAKINEIVNEK